MVKLASAVGWKTAREIEVLIARVALDDKKAFSVLYNTTHKKIFSVVLGILGNRADADDAVQETYLKIWRYANRYTTNGMSPMTWLIRIARNTAIDHKRATRTTVDLDCVVDYLATTDLNPEQNSIALGEARRIVACMAELNQDRAAAVRGVYLEGRSHAQLAETFNVPINTMKSQLHRSLKSLKVRMAR